MKVLKSTTRLVVVDVVAIDGKGAPAPDLKSSDFTLMEDGHPQQISIFSFQQPSEAPAETTVRLPANVFTNVPASKPTSLNVILLDALNGEFASRAYAREQLIKFLEEGHSAQPLAVYALESHLKLLHDFTTDTREAVSAIRGYKPQVLNHLDSLDAVASPFTQKGEVQTGPRNIEATLVALNFLAQALSGYPGRKNLIWLSEGFPMELFPDLFPSAASLATLHGTTASDSPGSFDTIRGAGQAGMAQASQSTNSTLWANSDYAAQVRKVANALMNAQVSVYPIDAAGVGKLSRVSNLATMRDVAERTGGKIFVGQNDLQASIRGSMDDGSTYYTLAYYPENKNWGGQLRQIDIKTSKPGINLRYRRGYYALDPSLTTKEDDSKKLVEEFSRGLALDVPSATAILFKAVLTSPANDNNKVVVNFAIDPHTLTFSEENGVHHASLSCAAVVFSEKGSLVKDTMSTINAPIPSADFQKLLDTTFPCRATIELKPGKYWMRLGVMDRSSRFMGTSTASVTVPVP
ncbi:MAG TPA: VWA domain-containing protein [Candidatus Angelobacter sp.]